MNAKLQVKYLKMLNSKSKFLKRLAKKKLLILTNYQRKEFRYERNI